MRRLLRSWSIVLFLCASWMGVQDLLRSKIQYVIGGVGGSEGAFIGIFYYVLLGSDVYSIFLWLWGFLFRCFIFTRGGRGLFFRVLYKFLIWIYSCGGIVIFSFFVDIVWGGGLFFLWERGWFFVLAVFVNWNLTQRTIQVSLGLVVLFKSHIDVLGVDLLLQYCWYIVLMTLLIVISYESLCWQY